MIIITFATISKLSERLYVEFDRCQAGRSYISCPELIIQTLRVDPAQMLNALNTWLLREY